MVMLLLRGVQVSRPDFLGHGRGVQLSGTPLFISRTLRNRNMIAPGASGHALNDASILTNAPAQSGVYALYNTGWVYIGESNDIQRRLQEHMRDQRIMQHRPTGFTFELVGAASRVARQDALISQLSPIANRT
jgi:hypothetical protein